MNGLEITLLYLAAAVLGVVLCRSFMLPPILGYLGIGIVIGPNALALAQSSENMAHLGEFGVVFLMFVIGLEFNLPKLKTMRRHVFGLGLAQVGLTLLIAPTASLALNFVLPIWSQSALHMSWQAAMALSGAVAMSSTALVVKLMSDRGELQTEHGKRVMGVLLFQDLAVVPLLVLIPALGANADQMLWSLVSALLKAALVIAFLLVGGQRVMHWWLTLVARRKSEELFILNVLLITLGLAWLTQLAGLSLALGSFIAGMLISETPYKHQVESEIRPFHDVLLGLFFISIGTLLDWRLVAAQWPLVLLLLVLPVVFKAVLITYLARRLGARRGDALRTGLYLAQAGEFGFVLLTLANESKLVPLELLNPILASMVLSMLMTPFIITHSNGLVLKLIRTEWFTQSLELARIVKKSEGLKDHVIICGFGRCGQNLAHLLVAERISYLALDLDPDCVEQTARQGDKVIYGDSTKMATLHAAGLARAKAVVISYIDMPSCLRLLVLTQKYVPDIPVIVRTKDDSQLEQLLAAGATEVVPDALEGSLMLASHALAIVGVPMRRVIRVVQEQRNARYSLLRDYYHDEDKSL